MSKSHFKLLVQYLDGLRGNQRGLAMERAREVMAQNEYTKDTGIAIYMYNRVEPPYIVFNFTFISS